MDLTDEFQCLCVPGDAFMYTTVQETQRASHCHLCRWDLIHDLLAKWHMTIESKDKLDLTFFGIPYLSCGTYYGDINEYCVMNGFQSLPWTNRDHDCWNLFAYIRQFFRRRYGIGVWVNPGGDISMASYGVNGLSEQSIYDLRDTEDKLGCIYDLKNGIVTMIEQSLSSFTVERHVSQFYGDKSYTNQMHNDLFVPMLHRDLDLDWHYLCLDPIETATVGSLIEKTLISIKSHTIWRQESRAVMTCHLDQCGLLYRDLISLVLAYVFG